MLAHLLCMRYLWSRTPVLAHQQGGLQAGRVSEPSATLDRSLRAVDARNPFKVSPRSLRAAASALNFVPLELLESLRRRRRRRRESIPLRNPTPMLLDFQRSRHRRQTVFSQPTDSHRFQNGGTIGVRR